MSQKFSQKIFHREIHSLQLQQQQKVVQLRNAQWALSMFPCQDCQKTSFYMKWKEEHLEGKRAK